MMIKLFTNKKAFNDVSILMGIISIFLVTAMVLPYVEQIGGDTETIHSAEGLAEELSEGIDDIGIVSPVGIKDFARSLLKVFFWSFGTLPFWIELVFVIMKITAVTIIARNIWIGGGG